MPEVNEVTWKDIDYVINVHSSARMFAGLAVPTDRAAYLSQLYLTMGASPATFAGNGLARFVSGDTTHFRASSKGPKGLKTTYPVRDIFWTRYADDALPNAQMSIANITAMLSVAKKAVKVPGHGISADAIATLSERITKQNSYNTLQLLDAAREGMVGAEVSMYFDYIQFDMLGYKLLRNLHAELYNDLANIVSAEYAAKPSSIIWSPGWIFAVMAQPCRHARHYEEHLLNRAGTVLDKLLSGDVTGDSLLTMAKEMVDQDPM